MDYVSAVSSIFSGLDEKVEGLGKEELIGLMKTRVVNFLALMEKTHMNDMIKLKGQLYALEQSVQTVTKEVNQGKLVGLSVGGQIFHVCADTLRAETGSMLAVLVSGQFEVLCDSSGNIFLDRDPKHFPLLMNYLRYLHNKSTDVCNPRSIAHAAIKEEIESLHKEEREQLFEEARFYGLTGFINAFYTQEYLFLVGGYGSRSAYPARTCELYNPVFNDWAVSSTMSTLRGRFYTAGVVWQNRIYVIGGWDAACRKEYNVVECFDPEHEKWTEISQLPAFRMCHSAVVHDGCIYVIGGATEQNIPLDTVWRFNIEKKQWDALPKMPHPRLFASAVVFEGEIYVLGGETSSSMLDAVDKFNPTTQEWVSMPPLTVPRRAFATVVVDGKIYALGGNGDRGYHTILNSVERYDPVTCKWANVANMQSPRSYYSATVFGGEIYVFGGDSMLQGTFMRLETVEKYNPATDTWTYRQPMDSCRSGHVVGVLVSMGRRDGEAPTQLLDEGLLTNDEDSG
eukprot:TRINITY_DN2035_c0_g1_i1.p1 TRINITY_DN2035_c0_g1~~TRINITY_DN2035_c0_g1_i1.p1  ORF type:complete len:512 (+),score=86.73 TRINITY_DN2035_c0_g1_i1:582-2117(+)